MHIITGMLIAGLLGKRKGKSLLPMLRTGPVRTEHVSPGRVRLLVPSLRGDKGTAATLAEKLATLQGVRSAQVSPISGSVLIHFSEAAVDPALLFGATVRLLGLDDELNRSPRPVVVKELQSMLECANRAVYDRTAGAIDFSSAVLILLVALGTKKLLTKEATSMPAGLTLVWWGLHQLLGHNQE